MLNIIIISILTFITVFIAHIIIWRTIKPKNQITWLLIIFIVAPIIILLTLFIINDASDLQGSILSILLYYALAGVYIQTYPAIQANCPSLFITYFIGKHLNGVDLNEIKNIVDSKCLTKVDTRIEDLVKDGFVKIDPSKKITLTSKGDLLATLFILYRSKFLGLTEGEG
jgi:hypothetical protein